ncbi:MAG: glycine cleavage system protein H [Candidatus Altiarchaeota archaeon]|nr:glycine cleavage system protein H [Candidatus Altiarchaeota archaeon]
MKLEDFEFPDDLGYMKGHIWVEIKEGEARLGVTSLGSSLAKEIVHVDLPENNEEFNVLDPMASFETIKSVTEISAPFDCRVTGVNEKLLDDPSLINTDPYRNGWIIKLHILKDNGDLMNVEEAVEYYGKILGKEKERYKGIYD